ncbi:MAG TPA: alpha/beta hydrolase-fold protein [Flavobacterium sp.]|nr:alpha/beta hydrolase-fold protein [Flavobacterium sp.]
MNRYIITAIFFISAFANAQSTASKQVSTFMIDAPQLGGQKKIWMYLPKNYTTSTKKYPVLYMHDAQNLFDAKTSFVGEWNVDEALDSINAQVIVVGIEHGNEKRMEELTPYPNDKYGGGKADLYMDFIVKNLKPYIDKTYRTKTNAKNTGIMGSSLGGLVSWYAALKYPDVFGKAGVFSPSFWFSNRIYELAESTPKIMTRVYFLCGDSESKDVDVVADMNKMTKIVSKKRCDCLDLTKKVVVKGGEHNEKLWRTQFLKAYLWLF